MQLIFVFAFSSSVLYFAWKSPSHSLLLSFSIIIFSLVYLINFHFHFHFVVFVYDFIFRSIVCLAKFQNNKNIRAMFIWEFYWLLSVYCVQTCADSCPDKTHQTENMLNCYDFDRENCCCFRFLEKTSEKKILCHSLHLPSTIRSRSVRSNFSFFILTQIYSQNNSWTVQTVHRSCCIYGCHKNNCLKLHKKQK